VRYGTTTIGVVRRQRVNETVQNETLYDVYRVILFYLCLLFTKNVNVIFLMFDYISLPVTFRDINVTALVQKFQIEMINIKLFSIQLSNMKVRGRVGSIFHGGACSDLNTASLPLLK